ncbi:chaplin [Streptomyces sp. NPDC057197]|uniref:chaplin n=1 Tax=Streptomyces sp. NPDC057197 TaxID=3346045 RepID=UPI0036351929
MKRVTRNGVIALAASGAVAMAVPVSAAFAADADGVAAGSPGLLSGNGVQLPVDVPVNVCGNTVNVVGLLNPAAGNRCANTSSAAASTGHGSDEAHGTHEAQPGGGATAHEGAKDSPGVLSGNGVQLPVHLPVNVSGNSVNVVGIGNPATGNTSVNTSTDRPVPHPVTPPAHPAPRPAPRPVTHPAPAAVPHTEVSLAHTGADHTMPAVAASAALLLGGTVLYRRFRPGAAR